MATAITITDKTTGESRVYTGYEWDAYAEFDWAENNYSCDCNRGLCFARAGGDNPDVFDFECGNERSRVDSVLHNGVMVYADEVTNSD